MGTDTINALVVVLLGGVFCCLLHWSIGRLQQWMARRYGLVPTSPSAPTPPLIRTLLLDWFGNGLRTLIWFLYARLLVDFMPKTRRDVETVGSRLRRLTDDSIDWLVHPGLGLLLTLIVTIFLMRFAAALIRTSFALMARGAVARDAEATQRRLQTLSSIFSGAAQSTIFFIGLLTLLQQLDVNITPILASAGVVGIAVGFGAQSLIKDLFSGFLILLEDQFSVGDIVRIAEFAGTVEQITLRATRIRGIDGSLTTIPNGNIATVSNLSKDWSRVVLDVEIDYREDVDRAMAIALATAVTYREESPQTIVEAPEMLGVDQVTYTSLVFRLLVKTAPAKQFETGRELRRRIKLAFGEAGIQTPLAKQQLLLPEDLTLHPGREISPVTAEERLDRKSDGR
ncbi:MAG: mechanosensitive ion channel family protein [Blastocatellia bacterium]|jgi:small-conductance mechanosensitive channel